MAEHAFWTPTARDAVSVGGPDAGAFLQSQLSQDVAALGVDDSRWTFLLRPTGKVDVLARVWCVAEDRYVLDTDGGFGGALVERLNRFRIRVKADVEPLAWSAVAVRATPAAEQRPAGTVVGWWDRDHDVLGEAPRPPDGVAEAPPDALERARVLARWPAMGAEIVPGETIPAETGLAAVAVSFTKGCYPGQELVERMDSRGATARRHLECVAVSAGARPGDPLVVDGAEVGVLSSVAGDVALASVRRGVDAAH